MTTKYQPFLRPLLDSIERVYADIRIWLLPCLKDNYIFIIYFPEVSQTIVVDPAQSDIVIQFLESKGLELNEIWVTHHHSDHIGGVIDLKKYYNCEVRGAVSIPGRIPGVSIPVDGSSHWSLSEFEIKVLELPGHTLDHKAYWIHSSELNDERKISLLFSGDVLFGLGCGRLFEGSYDQMVASLQKVIQLPPYTQIFCSHEYTELNLSFTLSENANDSKILERQQRIQKLRLQGKPTVPLKLEEELETNLFLKVLESKDPLGAFTLLREKRNKY